MVAFYRDAAGARCACRDRACSGGESMSLLTGPTLITGLRTVASLVLTGLAIVHHSEALLFIGLAAYLVGDVIDGQLARSTNTETRPGATLDIHSDRLCIALFYLTYVQWHPDMVLPVLLFLGQFMVLDQYLSVAFLSFPLLSPNYFYKTDARIHRLNWSPAGKAFNTVLLTVTILVTQSVALATVVVLAIIAVKVYSIARLHHVVYPALGNACLNRRRTP
jgi:CDP-diacylglycerol---glycerol-3-phosphate 3-phosphatidyltransferase